MAGVFPDVVFDSVRKFLCDSFISSNSRSRSHVRSCDEAVSTFATTVLTIRRMLLSTAESIFSENVVDPVVGTCSRGLACAFPRTLNRVVASFGCVGCVVVLGWLMVSSPACALAREAELCSCDSLRHRMACCCDFQVRDHRIDDVSHAVRGGKVVAVGDECCAFGCRISLPCVGVRVLSCPPRNCVALSQRPCCCLDLVVRFVFGACVRRADPCADQPAAVGR